MKQNLSSLVLVVSVVFGSVFAAGCGDDKEEKLKTLAPICESSTEALAGSSDLDGDTFMQYLENALKSCSAACDYDHDQSCTALGGHLEKLCTVTPDACESFCKSATGSLKTEACKQT